MGFGEREIRSNAFQAVAANWLAREKSRAIPMRAEGLGISLLSSVAIHICAIFIATAVLQREAPRQNYLPVHLIQNYLPVHLIEVPKSEDPLAKLVAPAETKSPPVQETKSPKETRALAKASISKSETPLPTAKSEPAKAPETKAPASAQTESPPSTTPNTSDQDGGSTAGAGRLFSSGDIDVVPGAGMAAGGGGTAAFGPGRGDGAPGLPSQTLLRTNREAKPIQTARANYPPIALRAGLESDVMLKIEVDAQGNVTKAEITKSGGGGFDGEALKAVKQSRFEPAQRDGQNVAAEFSYIYRFRLQR
jgi:TonB family protein